MTMQVSQVVTVPLERLGRSLASVRCVLPAAVERMVNDLSTHGQLTPVVTTDRGAVLEMVDGFKRTEAARRLGLKELRASVTALDETSQWAAMLSLNRGAGRMTELEEAFVLRKLLERGMTQEKVAQLVHRHKSWVSRRVGLLSQLHPELVEGMRLGLLHAGVARRLLSLPPGNQLAVATAAQQVGLGPRDTELLVSLWKQTTDTAAKKRLLADPVAALQVAHPELARPTPDPRLTPSGKQLARLLQQAEATTWRAAQLLPLTAQDLPVLAPALARTHQWISRFASSIGPYASGARACGNAAPDATGSSSS
jgi:ParB-like chromosome segregation protein Spo0J